MVEVIFTGCRLGSIGVRYRIKEWVKNDPTINEDACRLELSEKYEHIGKIELATPK